MYYKGYHGDTSATFLIGNVDAEGEVLVDVAKECRDNAINICGPNVPFNCIGQAIQ